MDKPSLLWSKVDAIQLLTCVVVEQTGAKHIVNQLLIMTDISFNG